VLDDGAVGPKTAVRPAEIKDLARARNARRQTPGDGRARPSAGASGSRTPGPDICSVAVPPPGLKEIYCNPLAVAPDPVACAKKKRLCTETWI